MTGSLWRALCKAAKSSRGGGTAAPDPAEPFGPDSVTNPAFAPPADKYMSAEDWGAFVDSTGGVIPGIGPMNG